MKKYLFALLAFFSGISSFGQGVVILDGDIKDAENLIGAYFGPLANGFGSGLNSGWYNTAKPHSLGGFDLTLTFNSVIIPKSGKVFNIKEAGGNTFISEDTYASTVIGSKEPTSMQYVAGGFSTSGFGGVDFEMPGSIIATKVISMPIIQAGVGIMKNTSIDFRFMPLIKVGKKVKVNLFGAGIKHDLLQWIPIAGDAIPLSLSIQAGYTSLNSELKISDQELEINTKATTLNLILSKKILMITGYASLGYSSSNTTLKANPNFDLDGIKFNDELNVQLKTNNELRANIGLRFNITLITIQADYTHSEYPTANLGIGVSFR